MSLCAVLLCLMPAVSAPLGGNDTGIWILPRAVKLPLGFPSNITSYGGSSLTSSGPMGPQGARASVVLTDFSETFQFRVSDMRVPPVVALSDFVTGLRVRANVVGGIVSFTPRQLSYLRRLPSGMAAGYITDINNRGYFMMIRSDVTQNRLVFEVY